MGEPEAHENPGLLAMSLVWFRYHNKLAERYARENPSWTDEQIYRHARKMLVAVLQVIRMLIIFVILSLK